MLTALKGLHRITGGLMEYSDLYAERIKQLCKSHGITINKLATLAGLKQSTVDNIIHGKSKNPKVRTLHKLATVFGMTLSEFLDFPELNDYSIDDEEEV
jgi:transcriptional regulator with XRE-family HTH domain